MDRDDAFSLTAAAYLRKYGSVYSFLPLQTHEASSSQTIDMTPCRHMFEMLTVWQIQLVTKVTRISPTAWATSCSALP